MTTTTTTKKKRRGGAASLNARVLVIDDEESVRDGFLTVLGPRAAPSAEIGEAADILFGASEPVAPRHAIEFQVDLACNGREGLALVEAALAQGAPYSVLFCDMRMPGWDGVETIEAIRRLDQRVEVVFVTAYSDHSLETIGERAGANVSYFVKPFVTEEVRQVATKLVLEWNKAREIEELLGTISSLRAEGENVKVLLRHVLRQLCLWMGTDSAALLRLDGGGPPRFEMGVGELCDGFDSRQVDVSIEEPVLTGETMFLPIREYGVAIAFTGSRAITPDRRHLLQIFLSHAGLAIRNSEYQDQLVARERLAAVGQALGFILHDVRGPIGTAKMLTRLVRLGVEDLGGRDELLDRVDAQMQAALDMVEDTLSMCRGRIVVEPRRCALSDVLSGPLELLRREVAERGVTLSATIPAGLEATIDPQRLQRVIWNLIRNAVDALQGRAEGRIELVATATPGGGVEVCVADNGPGVPQAVLEALCQVGATSGKAEGTGFGLAIVKQLVAAHGGTLAHSRIQDTTRFTISLPAVDGSHA